MINLFLSTLFFIILQLFFLTKSGIIIALIIGHIKNHANTIKGRNFFFRIYKEFGGSVVDE